jgi:predicted DNA-binding antitoxin AbrB/MazE fold protein
MSQIEAIYRHGVFELLQLADLPEITLLRDWN